MKILLSQDVENLGKMGEIVSVKDGYARNYLIPQRKAIQATEQNIKNIKGSLLKIDGIEEDNEAVKNLDIARMSMMNFMKDFSNEFSFDKYPMDKKTHDNLEGIDLLQVNNRLIEFKKSIEDVSEKFETSMSSGQKILDGIE